MWSRHTCASRLIRIFEYIRKIQFPSHWKSYGNYTHISQCLICPPNFFLLNLKACHFFELSWRYLQLVCDSDINKLAQVNVVPVSLCAKVTPSLDQVLVFPWVSLAVLVDVFHHSHVYGRASKISVWTTTRTNLFLSVCWFCKCRHQSGFCMSP